MTEWLTFLFTLMTRKKIYTGAQRFISHMRDVDVSWCSTEEIIVTLNKLICLNTENQQLSENGDLNETILPERGE